MLETLGDYFVQSQGGTPQPLNQNEISAGLIMSGMPTRDAYLKGAEIFREQEKTNIEKQKEQVKQAQEHKFRQLADYIRSNPNATNQEITARALEAGGGFANIPAFVDTVGTKEKLVEDTARGGPPVIHQYRGGVHTGVRAAMDGLAANLGGLPLRKETMSNQNTRPNTQSAPLPNMGLPAGEMTEEQALRLAQAPVQGANAPQEQQAPEEREIADEFLDYSLQTNPPKTEVPFKEIVLQNQKTYDKFKETSITKKLEAARDMNEGLNSLLEASEKFQTGFAGDARLAAKQLGEYLKITDPESVAAGELIRKVSAKIVLDFAKQMGGGVVSDKDIKFLKEMVPSLANTPEGNRQIVEYFKRLSRVSEAYATSAEKYYDTYGNLNAFEGSFNKFYKKRGDIFAKEIAELEAKKAEAKMTQQEKYNAEDERRYGKRNG